MPRPFARLIVGHDVRTTRDMGWEDLSNGELLAKAATSFDLMVTVDKSLLHQQNRTDLPLPVLVLRATSNTIGSVAVLAPEVLKLLGQALQNRVYILNREIE